MSHLKSYRIPSGDYSLQVFEQGRGDTLLIIGSAHYYRNIMPEGVYDFARCVFIDHRGFAACRRKPVESDVSLKQISADVTYVCRYLGIDSACVLGHSGHAYMALDFADRTPIDILGIILVGASPSLSAHYQALASARWEKEASARRKKILAENMALLEQDIAREPERTFVHLCRRLGAMRWTNPDYDEWPLWQGLITHTVLFDKLWGQVFPSLDVTQYCQRLSAPVLIVCGQWDYSIAPMSSWQANATTFKNVQYQLMDSSAHTPMLEAPDEFTRIVYDFLQNLSKVE